MFCFAIIGQVWQWEQNWWWPKSHNTKILCCHSNSHYSIAIASFSSASFSLSLLKVEILIEHSFVFYQGTFTAIAYLLTYKIPLIAIWLYLLNTLFSSSSLLTLVFFHIQIVKKTSPIITWCSVQICWKQIVSISIKHKASCFLLWVFLQECVKMMCLHKVLSLLCIFFFLLKSVGLLIIDSRPLGKTAVTKDS